MQKKRPWGRGEKALLGVILAAVLLSSGGYALWQRNAVLPSLVVPTPTMPRPNAFDVFQAAVRAEVQVGTIAGIGPMPGQRPSQAAEEAAVAANAAALRLLRRGLALPYRQPPIRSLQANMSYYAGFRSLARLLNEQATLQEQRGEWGDAADSRLDAVALGIQVPRGGPVEGMLVGIACQAIGRKALWSDIPLLTAPQARAAARRMERLTARQLPPADTFQEDEWTGQASLLGSFRSPSWRRDLLSYVGTDNYRADIHAAPLQAVRYPFLSRRDILSDYTRYMDDAVADAGRPYAAPDPAPPGDLFSLRFASPYRLVRHRATGDETQNALLTAALALRAYRVEHGAYPPTLNALVPGYLSRVPDDPFAASGPLRYKVSGAKYVLYSIGPDGRDDGGRPISGSTPGSVYSQPDSQGDIVAGINLF